MKRSARRTLLAGTAELRAVEPGSDAAGLPQGEWLPTSCLQPAAAAGRELGRWLADGSAGFDGRDWWYRAGFESPAHGKDERIVLGFDGLATLATVWLNGRELLAGHNMFVSHECDVTDRLRAGGNELLMRFAALDPVLAQRRPRPRWRVPMLVQQQLRWVRTTLLGRTPGWSPPAPPIGPWRDVWLERRGALHATDLRVHTLVERDEGIVQCRLRLAGSIEPGSAVELRLAHGGRTHAQQLAETRAGEFAGELRIADARLWWPHTHGEPVLYDATVVVAHAGSVRAELAKGRIGIRTVALATDDGDFRVVVNGAPVFCRGACWTPLDVVSLRSTPADCRAAVQQACEAGMNMLRVAGTMVYEEDHFYEACDELGMLVWQDFMFANMDYPGDDEAFRASVQQEVAQQLQRLHAHASLAVLCGNSEAQQQAAMWGAPRGQWQAPLFESTIAQLCAAHAPGTPYWPSSAHGGAVPFQADCGTTSYYGVGAYLRPLEDARRADLRFATECLAFANVPGDAALARMPGGLATRVHHPQWKARSPRDLGAGWDFDDVRDHYLQLLFGAEPRMLRHADHARYLALSRMVTGEVMAAAFSEWRRPRSRCGGALVLFLRDLWAGAGWGLLDERGAPKACWHALGRVLQPRTVLLTDEGGNGLVAHAINERAQEMRATLELTAWRGGEAEVASGRCALAVPARGARTVPALELLDHFMDLTYAYRFGPPPCDAVRVALHDEQGMRIAQAFHFPAGMPALFGLDAGLSAQARMIDARTAELTVAARRLALGVHFDAPGFEPQDEWFHLAPGGQARVLLRGDGATGLHGTVHAINGGHGVAIAT